MLNICLCFMFSLDPLNDGIHRLIKDQASQNNRLFFYIQICPFFPLMLNHSNN